MKKRALSVLCVIALCLTLLPSAALAADEADEWTYVGESGYIQSADGQIRLEISINETDKAITITKAAAVPENCVLVLPK